MAKAAETLKQKRDLEQNELLLALQGMLELPMVILSFIMLVLFIVELTADITRSARQIINLIQWGIWVAFVIEYATKLALAPDKGRFLKENWLMTLSIILPVFRVFRIVRAARAVRSFGVLRVITAGNRTINKLKYVLGRRHLQYVAAVTVAIAVLSAAGVYFVERNTQGANITTFGDALWWSAGTITTVGTELFPVSVEGRILAVALMVFGVSVFGYVAGSLASMFVHLDQSDQQEQQAAAKPGGDECSDDLLRELGEVQARLDSLTRELNAASRRRGR